MTFALSDPDRPDRGDLRFADPGRAGREKQALIKPHSNAKKLRTFRPLEAICPLQHPSDSRAGQKLPARSETWPSGDALLELTAYLDGLPSSHTPF